MVDVRPKIQPGMKQIPKRCWPFCITFLGEMGDKNSAHVKCMGEYCFVETAIDQKWRLEI